jgi:hypothetical protein
MSAIGSTTLPQTQLPFLQQNLVANQGSEASEQIMATQKKMEEDNTRTQIAMFQLNLTAERDKTRADAEKTRHDIVMAIAGNIR